MWCNRETTLSIFRDESFGSCVRWLSLFRWSREDQCHEWNVWLPVSISTITEKWLVAIDDVIGLINCDETLPRTFHRICRNVQVKWVSRIRFHRKLPNPSRQILSSNLFTYEHGSFEILKVECWKEKRRSVYFEKYRTNVDRLKFRREEYFVGE